jgi:hypothetical protein
MTGWTRRRSSGEIMNATLLEVFLALVFLVFALAVFHQRRADAAEEKIRGSISTHEAVELERRLAAARDSLATARRVANARLDSLQLAAQTIAKLRFDSPYPPDCEPKANPAWLLTITLTGPAELTVLPHRAVGGLTPNVAFKVSPAAFRQHFAGLLESSRREGCRYYVRVQDTPNIPKAEYKVAMAAITSVFRFRGAFQ